ncbi:MAG: SDR family NAD(P)-dependent oxidoreductase [Flavobacteriales bacterium]|nr:SDR family NAD(P)-dependent oxidoreductase [Flavobacteriales bacterium]
MGGKAIIIGASSGIGLEITNLLIKENYSLGLIDINEQKLGELKEKSSNHIEIQKVDCTKLNNAVIIKELITKIGGLDLLILSAGIGNLNKNIGHTIENKANFMNVLAFTEIIDSTYRYFEKRNKGHLVAITSVAGLRGNRIAPAYHAAKAYQINYLEGLRQKSVKNKSNITVTDIRPGFVDTPLTKDKKTFWNCSVQKAAKQIYTTIKNKDDFGYVSRRWVIIGFLLKNIPNFLFKRV